MYNVEFNVCLSGCSHMILHGDMVDGSVGMMHGAC